VPSGATQLPVLSNGLYDTKKFTNVPEVLSESWLTPVENFPEAAAENVLGILSGAPLEPNFGLFPWDYRQRFNSL
jgi:hypothetical protein